MKILIFNHHPDFSYQLWKGFSALGHQVYFASENLSLSSGANFSSTVGSKFLFIDQLVEPSKLYSDINVEIKENLEEIDVCITTQIEIAQKLNHKNIIYAALRLSLLENNNEFEKYLKISTCQYAKYFGALYLSYYVAPVSELTTGGKLVQLISHFEEIPITKELKQLKAKGLPVVIAGSKNAPDGIVNDREMLKSTSLLVHEKNIGSNCNAVCKAFDAGVPVYLSMENRNILGFSDLPEYMFIFSDFHTVEEAFKISKAKNNKEIQSTFRAIRSLSRLKSDLYNIISHVDIKERKKIMEKRINPIIPKNKTFLSKLKNKILK